MKKKKLRKVVERVLDKIEDRARKSRVKPRAELKISREYVATVKAAFANRKQAALEGKEIFSPAKPPPGVLPLINGKEPEMAMDENSIAITGWAANYYPSAIAEGQTFLGYPYLAELLQRAEYRRPVEVIATQMTRKWIKITATGGKNKDDDKSDKIKKIEAEFKRLDVRGCFQKAISHNEGFGRGHIYLDIGDTSKPTELQNDIGDGKDTASKGKVGTKKPLRRLKNVEPVWTYPQDYNATDPLDPAWYRPEMWYVMAKQIHASRLLTFIGREVPDMLKPAYSFGGLSLVQMMKPYVDNWLRVRQSVSDLVNAFSVMVLHTNMGTQAQPGGNKLLERLDLFNVLRDNANIMAVDEATEDFSNVAAPLGTLDQLQAQAQEHMAAVCGIPLVFLLGISPHGMNASSEGEIRVFYDWIASYQEHLFRPNLTRVLGFVQLSLFGVVDPEIDFSFEPLWSLDEKALAEVKKTEAETDNVDIQAGVLSPEERRKAIANDPDSRHQDLVIDDLPDLLEEETEGLEPHASAEKLAAGGEQDDEDGPSEKTSGKAQPVRQAA